MFAQLHESLLNDFAVKIDLVTHFFPSAFHLAIAVVVGHEEYGAVGVDALDDLDELVVVPLEILHLKVFVRRVVDADAEDDEVGTDEVEVALEVVAAQVRGYSSSVDAHAMYTDAWHAVFKQHACEGELAWHFLKEDADGVGICW